MSRSIRSGILFAVALFSALSLAAAAADAQVPDKFTNLQYFPKDISRQQLIATMRGFSFSLDVRCQFCHAAKAGNSLEQMDFAGQG